MFLTGSKTGSKRIRAVANEFGRPIKVLHADNGCEFDNSSILEYMKGKGIKVSLRALGKQREAIKKSSNTLGRCFSPQDSLTHFGRKQ